MGYKASGCHSKSELKQYDVKTLHLTEDSPQIHY